MEKRLKLRETRTLPEMGKRIYERFPLKVRMMENVLKPLWGRYRVNVFDIAAAQDRVNFGTHDAKKA